jgi:hypothetical protein
LLSFHRKSSRFIKDCMSTSNVVMSVERLDGRHSASNKFIYRIVFQGPAKFRFIKFSELRQECWNVWGPSNERDLHLRLWQDTDAEHRNDHWCWHHDIKLNSVFIYLKGDEEASYIKLKWM